LQGEKKTEQLNRVDERIARLQKERACVQRTSDHDALQACRKKFEKGSRQEKHNMKK